MQAPDFQVVGCATNGKEGIELVATLKPDLITMDIEMPVMDGFETTKTIMAEHPTPIVIISAQLSHHLHATFLALNAGALSVLNKPININSPNFSQHSNEMLATLRTLATVKVKSKPLKKATKKVLPSAKSNLYKIVAIGASVGGPQALKTILTQLPKDFPAPIVVVQHMTPGFIAGFTTWLNNNVSLNVKCAEENEILEKGTIYFAPDDYHLTISKHKGDLTKVHLVKGPPNAGFCPSINILFESVTKVYGRRATGILLTGMGSDGAKGLLSLKQAHGLTLAQDKETAIVFGMAGVAQQLGAVEHLLSPDDIADYLIRVFLKDNSNTKE